MSWSLIKTHIKLEGFDALRAVDDISVFVNQDHEELIYLVDLRDSVFNFSLPKYTWR